MQLYGVENTKVFELTLYALIPAAGAGTRLRGEIPKQYLPLAGKPMLWHAVKSVSAAPIENVFVVLAPEDKQFAQLDWSAFAGRLEPLYCGGETRRDTVYNGMVAAMAVVDADDWVLVHDAARPCLPRQDLENLIRETGDDPVGGILALRVAEVQNVPTLLDFFCPSLVLCARGCHDKHRHRFRFGGLSFCPCLKSLS